MVKRRKLLIGMGSVATGSAAIFGTSATTTFSVNDRQVGANVVTDSNGAVKLSDSTSGGIVKQNASGELEIDFANGKASGVNIGSVVDVGDYTNPNRTGGGPDGDPAFRIVNQTTSQIDLEVDFVPDSAYNVKNSDGSVLRFGVERNSFGALYTNISDTETTAKSSPSSGTSWRSDGTTVSSGTSVQIFDLDDTVNTLAPGAQVFVAFQVDADRPGSHTDDNLSGTLDITATQPQADN